MTDHLIANDPITAELQDKAVSAFKNADKAEGLRRGSRLMLTYCLIQAWDAPCEAMVKNQKGETVFSHAFTVGDYCNDAHVASACGDNSQARGAMAKAVINRLSGIAEPSSAQKQALNAARPVAFGLVEKLGDEAATAVALTKRGNVTVPGHVMLKEPDAEKASESQLETYEREKALPFVLDGIKGRSFNELSSRVKPKAEREGSSGQGGDEGKAMSRLEAARIILRGAAGGEEWVEYLAALPSAEVVAMVRAWGERDADND